MSGLNTDKRAEVAGYVRKALKQLNKAASEIATSDDPHECWMEGLIGGAIACAEKALVNDE